VRGLFTSGGWFVTDFTVFVYEDFI